MKNLIGFTLQCLLLLTFPNAYALSGPHFKKVVVIVFENTNYNDAIKNPIFKNLAANGALFTNFLAETHPSQGNYISMIAGSTMNVKNDENIDLDGKHLGDLLEEHNLTFKAYAENYPGNCFTGKSAGRYARKHVPFLSFKNVSTNSSRCLNIEKAQNFFSDFKNDSLPNFSIFVPDLIDDGHDSSLAVAGVWLQSTFGALLSDPSKLGDTLFILTFDEATKHPTRNQIYTAVIGKNVIKGALIPQEANHISLLKMIEDEFQLGNLGREDAKALPINGLF